MQEVLAKFKEWRNKFVDNLAIDLKLEFPDITGFSPRNIRYMRKFADEYQDEKFLQEVIAKVTWYHNVILMDKVKNIEERKWYIIQTIKNGWSTNILKNQIKNKLYERQAIADKTTNFENTLLDIQSDLALQTLKDPYIFDFIALKGQVKEKEIEEAMITKIKNVLLELRNRFCFCWKSI